MRNPILFFNSFFTLYTYEDYGLKAGDFIDFSSVSRKDRRNLIMKVSQDRNMTILKVGFFKESKWTIVNLIRMKILKLKFFFYSWS